MRTHKYFQHDRLIVFGRYPVPGGVKTRLIPALGTAGAADLQRRLTEKTLETAKAFALGFHLPRFHYCIEVISIEYKNKHS
jgi:glycosyltransferase A (GT-A) superfamily protein (DUF2064 family)